MDETKEVIFCIDEFRKELEKIKAEHYLEATKREETAEETLELCNALLHYRKKGKTHLDIASKVRTDFRKNVARFGYEGIEAQMIPIIRRYGTAEEKIALCYNALIDMENDIRKPLITEEEAKRLVDDALIDIRQSHSSNVKALREWWLLMRRYEVLSFAYKLYGAATHTYLTYSLETSYYIHLYEWTGLLEGVLNKIETSVTSNAPEVAEGVAKECNSFLKKFQKFGNLQKVGGEWNDTERKELFQVIRNYGDRAGGGLSYYKATLEGIKDWIRNNKGMELFIPMRLRNCLSEEDATIEFIPSKYYTSYIKELREQGIEPTEENNRLAMLNIYDEVGRDESEYKKIIETLDEKFRGHKQ